MSRPFPVYIKIDEEQNRVRTSGIPFCEFAQALGIKEKNLLILSGAPLHCDYHRRLGLEYVEKEKVEGLMTEQVDWLGDFCWLDFKEKETLDKVTKQELMEMLYLRHCLEAYDGFTFKNLQNEYAYCSHDDGWLCWIYMKNLCDYKKVIAYDLQMKCKGRRKSIAPPDDAVLDQIYEYCRQGAVIDYACMEQPGNVNMIPVGKTVFDLDVLFETLDRYRRKKSCLRLSYHARKKAWEVCQW